MDDNEDVHDQVCDAKDVGVVGFSFCSRKKLHHAADSQKFVNTNFWIVEAKVKVKDVRGNHREDIKAKLKAVDVTVP